MFALIVARIISDLVVVYILILQSVTPNQTKCINAQRNFTKPDPWFLLNCLCFCQIKCMYTQDFIHDTDEGYYLFSLSEHLLPNF